MAALQSDRRRALEKAVKDARDVAEQGARAALEGLAVHHHEPHSSMTPAQRDLRTRLRAHGRQLGDDRDERKGGQQIDRLVAECAYEHWHRMLFARFLAENDLLIEPESGAAVTLDECAELAKGTRRDAWEVAGSFAQLMLPQVFRTDDPVLQLALSPETRIELEKQLVSLPREVFLADDSLGWTYQFWQSAEKDRVNERAKGGEKITGRTLPAVTQLFTEHYMVLFLLHNTIGAWWAAKQMAKWTDQQHAACADESAVRRGVAPPDYNFDYLRFVRDEATKRWRPAAGTFESWPREARDLRVLDPCCGSGHFLVAAFELLTRLRESEEGLLRDRASIAVLEANLFGLELDPRCTQIAAFSLAFAAWKGIGRVSALPPLRIACSGLAIHGTREEWAKLAGDDALLRGALESLHATFAQAHELGSLVDPRRADVGGFKLTVDFERLLPLLTVALKRESVKRDAEQIALGVAAQGLAIAAELLSQSYTLVVTNVPYLSRNSHADLLKAWADTNEKEAKTDLATIFISRLLRWVGRDEHAGTIAAVTPQNWLFLTSYRKFRERLLKERAWKMVARLGPGAFETIGGQVVNVALVTISGDRPAKDAVMAGIDVAAARLPAEKAALLRGKGMEPAALQSDGNVLPPIPNSVTHGPADPRTAAAAATATPLGATSPPEANFALPAGAREMNFVTAAPDAQAQPADSSIKLVLQAEQLGNPDARVTLSALSRTHMLADVASFANGLQSGDFGALGRSFWELFPGISQEWRAMQGTVDSTALFGGLHYVINFGVDGERLDGSGGAVLRGSAAWGRAGIAVSAMNQLNVATYSGELYNDNCVVITPTSSTHLPSIWAFCSSPDYFKLVRAVDQALKVRSALIQVPFDVDHWHRIAADEYPCGLPEPQSNDPTQWLFHGHPAGMLAAGPAMNSQFGIADPIGAERHASLICREPNPAALLQVAVARLVGYRWPAELNDSMRLDAAVRAWVTKCKDLARFADDDGVVPLVPLRGELDAESRVRGLFRAALGDWSATREATVLAATAAANCDTSPASNLDDWLRNRCFAEHCALYHHRPFVWHIWDGRKKDGFGALVHYHRLVAPNGAGRRLLEKLTHGYLGDWITRQRDEANAGKEGADRRLTASLALQEKLTRILEGEPPFDIFARWKPLHQQPIGWEPDINDGVRINIRPFIEADVLRVAPKIKWTKDRGNEPQRPKADFPWFWGWDERTEDFAGGSKFTGERFNDLHYTTAFKRAARERRGER